ncbi:MAG: outer membrane protein transport protein [Bacteroidetes bacterium]|nr:outer membrane protein transport protein [Bacteroidota bacterium]
MYNKYTLKFVHLVSVISFLLLTISIQAQRNGDSFSFQGFDEPNDLSVRALAGGGAYTATSGNLDALFYNPAGLAGIKKLQISISAASRSKSWQDNQIWYPGGSYLLLPQYMENLYTPPKEFNGIWSDSLGSPLGLSWNPADFRQPVTGEDPYSEEAADFENTISNFGLNNIAVAYPFQLLNKNVVVSAAYSFSYGSVDFDWNGDHLDPHWGTSISLEGAAPQDSIVRSNWDVYTRERSLGTSTIKGGVGIQLSDLFELGVGITTIMGSTDDVMRLDRIGYFKFIQGGDNWSFSYENRSQIIKGTSDFSATAFNTGGIITFDNLSLGINLQLPYTIERDWSYNRVTNSAEGTTTEPIKGTDKMKIPLGYNLGIKFKPLKTLSVQFDYEHKPYGSSELTTTVGYENDSSQPVWQDQKTISAGVEFKVADNLSLLAGYRSRTAAFITYGAAIRNEGFPIESYTVGLSYQILIGTLDLAYEIRSLKYYDVYFTSRNYTMVTSSNLLVGYTISL